MLQFFFSFKTLTDASGANAQFFNSCTRYVLHAAEAMSLQSFSLETLAFANDIRSLRMRLATAEFTFWRFVLTGHSEAFHSFWAMMTDFNTGANSFLDRLAAASFTNSITGVSANMSLAATTAQAWLTTVPAVSSPARNDATNATHKDILEAMSVAQKAALLGEDSQNRSHHFVASLNELSEAVFEQSKENAEIEENGTLRMKVNDSGVEKGFIVTLLVVMVVSASLFAFVLCSLGCRFRSQQLRLLGSLQYGYVLTVFLANIVTLILVYSSTISVLDELTDASDLIFSTRNTSVLCLRLSRDIVETAAALPIGAVHGETVPETRGKVEDGVELAMGRLTEIMRGATFLEHLGEEDATVFHDFLEVSEARLETWKEAEHAKFKPPEGEQQDGHDVAEAYNTTLLYDSSGTHHHLESIASGSDITSLADVVRMHDVFTPLFDHRTYLPLKLRQIECVDSFGMNLHNKLCMSTVKEFLSCEAVLNATECVWKTPCTWDEREGVCKVSTATIASVYAEFLIAEVAQGSAALNHIVSGDETSLQRYRALTALLETDDNADSFSAGKHPAVNLMREIDRSNWGAQIAPTVSLLRSAVETHRGRMRALQAKETEPLISLRRIVSRRDHEFRRLWRAVYAPRASLHGALGAATNTYTASRSLLATELLRKEHRTFRLNNVILWATLVLCWGSFGLAVIFKQKFEWHTPV